MGIALRAFPAIFLIGLSFPAEWTTEERITIRAPAETVFPLIADLRNWKSWTIWFEHDPEMDVQWHGPETGVGSGYDWAGNSSVGSGTVRVQTYEPGNRIEFRLSMDEDRFVANGTLLLGPKPKGGSSVVWRMQGQLGYDPFARFHRDGLESAVKGTLRESLKKLKEVAEHQKNSP